MDPLTHTATSGNYALPSASGISLDGGPSAGSPASEMALDAEPNQVIDSPSGGSTGANSGSDLQVQPGSGSQPQPGSGPGPAEPAGPPSRQNRPFSFNRRALLITTVIVVVLALIGGGVLLMMNRHKPAAAAKSPNNFAVSNLPTNNSGGVAALEVGGANQLTVNGQLQVSKTLVLTPTVAPGKPAAGQIYYGSNDNILYYFNGTAWVALTQQAPNQGVSSFQGATGNVTLNGQAGISINGTTISNSGVLSLAGTPNQISVSASSGNVQLSLPQDIATTSTPTFGGLTLGAPLSVTSGGTGVNGFTAKGILYGNGTGSIQNTNSASNSVLVTNGSGAPSLSQTLPLQVQGNITLTGTLNGGAITAGFGTISTVNNITTTALIQGGSLEITGGNFTVDAAGNITTAGMANIEGPGGVAVGVAGSTTGSVVFNNSSNSHNTTLQAMSSPSQDQLITIPVSTASTDTVCLLTLANCIGAGSDVSSVGTENYISKFTNEAANIIGNSLLYDNGVSVGIGTDTPGASYLLDINGNINAAGSATVGTGLTVTSGGATITGDILQSGSGSFTTGSGAVSLNGPTSVTGANTFTVGSGATSLGGTLDVGDLATLNGGANIGGTTTITGLANINISGTANTSIGNATGSFSLISSGLNVSTAGGLSGITGYNQSGGDFVQSGSGNFSTGSGTVSLNGATTVGSTLDVQGAGGLTVGVAGTTAGQLALANSSNTNLSILQSAAPSGTGNATYNLPSIAGGTSDTVCLLSLGNCVGTGDGITGSGTPGNIAKFSSTGVITDSTLSESGSALTASGTLTVQGANALTLGTGNSNTGAVSFKNASNGNTLTLQAGATTGNLTFTLPTADGANGDCLQTDGFGHLSLAACTGGTGGGVTTLNGLAGVISLANATPSGSTITINNASTSQKGIAQFNATNFTDNGSGTINTVQDIATTSSPTFANLTATGAINGATISGGTLSGGNISGGSVSGGSLTATTVNGLSVSGGVLTNPTIAGTVTGTSSPNITGFGTYNGQTISSTANFTGTVAIQGANALTLGMANSHTGAIVFQGSGGAGTVTLQGPTTPNTGNYSLLIPAITGNATICTDNSVCAGYAPATGGNYIAKNAADTSTASTTGVLLALSNTNPGAAGVLGLTNSGTNSALSILQNGSSEPGVGQALILANNNTTTPTGNLLDLQTQGTSELHVDVSGNLTAGGNIQGVNIASSGTLTVGALGTANTNSIVCLNASNQIANCSASGTGTPFVQGGNSLGGTAVFGTNDNNGINIITNTATVASISNTGATLFKNSVNSTMAFAVQNTAGANLLNVDTSNNIVTVGNSGGLTGAWNTNANALPQNLSDATSVTANGYVYVMGGSNAGTAQSTVYYAKLNSDGSTGTWSTNTNALPQAISQATSATANGYVYVMGGSNSGNKSTVYYAKLNADGSTGAWSTNANALPNALSGATSAAANGYVYVMGGIGSGGPKSAVYYAKLNGDGSIGAWSTNTNVLPGSFGYATSVVANGYIYQMGGITTVGGAQSTVYYAKLNADGSTGTWQTNANALPAGRQDATSVVVNGYVYEIGGSNSTSQSTVYYAQLNSDGSTGTWQTNANVLPQSISDATSVTANGYVYVMGGSGINTVYYASLGGVVVENSLSGANGNLTVSSTLTAAGSLIATGSATFQDATNSTTAFQVQNASGASLFNVDTSNNIITLDGNNSGETGPWKTNTNALPTGLIQATSVTANGYVYEIGGYNGSSPQSTVYYAKLNSDGSTSAWQTSANALPATTDCATSVTANGYVYVIGGADSGGCLNGSPTTVYYAKLNANGSTGTWQTNANALPAGADCATSVTANGYVYVIGGDTSGTNCGGGTGRSTIYYAKLNSDGSTSAWQTSANALTASTCRATSITANGYVYVMGGAGTGTGCGGSPRSTIYYAKLNSDGSTSAWQTSANALPAATACATSITANGYVYVMGGSAVSGSNCSSPQSTIYYAKLNSDGSTGAWSTNTNALPAATACATSITANGYVYVMGGAATPNTNCNGAVTQSTVYYASLARIVLGGSLDLVGLQGGTLSDPGDQSLGSTGGSLTAGNGLFVGTLQVQGQASFAQGVTISGNLNTNGSVFIQNATNSVNSFQIQNSSGTNLLNADTTNMRVGVDVNYVAMATPTGLSVGAATSGGSLTANATYMYKVTAIDSAGGETAASTEASGTVGASGTQTLPVTWTAVAGASGYRVYRTAANGASGSEVYLTTVLTNSFTDSGAITAGTGTPPTSTTANLSTNNSNSSLQLSVGGNGTPTGQVYVSGTVPASAVGSVATDVQPQFVYVQGHYAYVANKHSATSGTLQIYDVSNPASPILLSTTPTTNIAINSVYVQGRYAYVGTGIGFEIYDISNPISPVRLQNISNIGSMQSIYVQGRYAYVIRSSDDASGGPAMLIYDVSNPANLVRIGSIATGVGPTSVYVQGRYAYITNGGSYTLQIVDVSNPASPVNVGSASTVNSSATSVYVQGRYAYVGSGVKLQVFNVSNPASPVSVGSVTTVGTVNSVYVQGRYAYVGTSSSNTLQTIDVSNPASPVNVGSVTTTNNVNSVYVQGRYAYVINYTGSNTAGSLQIFDLGGEYTQQLEAGGAEVGTLQVDTDGSVTGDLSVGGGLQIGQSLQASGNLGISGGANIQGSTVLGGSNNQLSVPAAPTVTPAGTTGSQRWDYVITALNASGGETTASTAGTTSSGNQTLSATNYNAINWSAVPGAIGYKIYRTYATGGHPSSTGLIGGTISTSFNDTGLVGNTSAPTINTTGQLTVEGSALFQNSTNSTTAFQVQNSSGTSLLDADTTNGRVGINNSAPGNLLSIGALTTAAGTYQIAVSTGGATSSGIVVQTVAGQSGGNILQAQDSTGATLASIDYQGNLTVKAATITGVLTVNGHVVTGNTSGSTTATVGGNAGSGATCTVSGNDTAGQITLTTGTTGWVNGLQCTVNFSSSYGGAPHPVITPASNVDVSAVKPYVGSSASSFTINFVAADTAQNTYTFNYFNAQ